jgi:hypothetical protein
MDAAPNEEIVSNTFTFVLYHAGKYARGCPSNASPAREGWGSTPEAAIENCRPWANQAPWFVETSEPVYFTDRPGASSPPRDEEIAAWDAFGWDADIAGDKGVLEALSKGLYATAARRAVEAGLLT